MMGEVEKKYPPSPKKPPLFSLSSAYALEIGGCNTYCTFNSAIHTCFIPS